MLYFRGYLAPEYAIRGQLTRKADIYSFGVVLLELITGRRTIDNTRPLKEQNLVYWVSFLNHYLLIYIVSRGMILSGSE